MLPPPDYPSSPYPFVRGGALTPAARNNPVLSIAMRYLGVPYQWGGARPRTGFDCSGLVQYVFAQLGVSLPHYAAAQYYSPDAVWVPPERLKPGDLVFFTGSDGTRKAPGHVGIYVGDGYLIDAPHTGSFVRTDSLDERWFANEYVGAKRIVAPIHASRALRASKDEASPPNLPVFLPRQMTGLPLGGSSTHTSAPQDLGFWTGGSLAGVLLLLGGAGVRYRSRTRLPAASSSTAEATSQT
jgi:hypothetical protein